MTILQTNNKKLQMAIKVIDINDLIEMHINKQ